MSGIHRTKIDWADSTWNPVSGCLHGCPYCYARNIARRFQPKLSEWPENGTIYATAHDPRCFVATKPTVLRDADGNYLRSTPYPKGFAPTMHGYKLQYLKTAKEPRRIFVGSMTDLFGDWVPDEWLAAVFRECHEAPQHVYMFLTKNPKRYTELAEKHLLPEGDNYWWGTSAPTPETEFWYSQKHNTFVSIEPILAPFETAGAEALANTNWVIAGAMTGAGARKYRPERIWVENIRAACESAGVPLFMKDSLTDIWGKPLIREHPEKMMAHINKVKVTDWARLEAHKVRVESVRDKKNCRQCGESVQGKPATRISGRFYICDKCYKGGTPNEH
ncbi:DUF5131 family protein [Desulfitobacterium sp.]|uniref:DUF5131 family protein n=1 Tax=Desulfitobacterium sp. TaxID=49981 RepID=UPI002B20A95F|nr:DUF5131 family protein [Desulfitobacterium sp.]MEA4901872.1 DUF5131 family protein [Desulfitobacterium sp.]